MKGSKIVSIFIIMFVIISMSGISAVQKTGKKSPLKKPVNNSFKNISDSNLLYNYDPQNRRDPFYDLLKGLKAAKKKVQKGVKPFYITEIQLTGIIGFKGQYSAMVVTPEGEAYSIKKGDKLMDGVVEEVGADYVKFIQVLKSPIMLKKTREIIKRINIDENSKE